MLHDEPPPTSPPPPRVAALERAGASYPPSHADPPPPARDAQDAESIESVDITMSPPQSLNTEPENLGARSSTTTRKPRALPDMQTMATRRAYKQALKRTMPPTPPKADATPEPTVAELVATLATLKNVMISNQQLIMSRLERLEGIIRDSNGPRSPAATTTTPAEETPVKKQNVEVPKKNAIPLMKTPTPTPATQQHPHPLPDKPAPKT